MFFFFVLWAVTNSNYSLPTFFLPTGLTHRHLIQMEDGVCFHFTANKGARIWMCSLQVVGACMSLFSLCRHLWTCENHVINYGKLEDCWQDTLCHAFFLLICNTAGLLSLLNKCWVIKSLSSKKTMLFEMKAQIKCRWLGLPKLTR